MKLLPIESCLICPNHYTDVYPSLEKKTDELDEGLASLSRTWFNLTHQYHFCKYNNTPLAPVKHISWGQHIEPPSWCPLLDIKDINIMAEHKREKK